ncbi:hypothetical protein DP148_26445 [Salmonella enterica subsp. enterica serovar Typhimurium]|nr:hypothetical protein DP148_26445 [Salmonella enterica subsp. enterica serovar Typhimurium]
MKTYTVGILFNRGDSNVYLFMFVFDGSKWWVNKTTYSQTIATICNLLINGVSSYRAAINFFQVTHDDNTNTIILPGGVIRY